MVILNIGILLVLYTIFSQLNGRYKTSAAFLFVFVTMAFQYGVPGDFDGYQDSYNFWDDNSSTWRKGEYVWFYLTKFSRIFFDFHVFVFLLSAFEIYVIKKYIDRYTADLKYGYICAIIFFFTFNFMLLQMKAMRQGLATELAILALLFVDDSIKGKKYLFCSCLAGIAAYYSHHSSLILLAMVAGYYYYVQRLEKNPTQQFENESYLNWRFPTILVVGAFIIVYLKRMFLDQYLPLLLGELGEDRYSGYIDEIKESEIQSLSVLFYDFVIIFLMGLCFQYSNRKWRYITLMGIIGIYVDILCFGIGSAQRILVYFVVFNLILYPKILDMLEKNFGKSVAYFFLMLFMGYAYKTSSDMMFDTARDGFGTYQIIFFAK